jgi:microcin C transport system substrate-binding protein
MPVFVMPVSVRPLFAAWLAALFLALASPAMAQTRSGAVAILKKPALPADFAYFPYVNPDAPKGGEAVLGAVGTFDSFNPFIVRGSPATDISHTYDTLLRDNADEANAGYGHLAQVIEIAADGRSVAFELRPEARFHDGAPVTAEDVAWTFEMLRTHGRPTYRQYYADVQGVTVEGPRRVSFQLKSAANRELPLILGQLVVLPKHWWATRDFTRPLTEIPLGSGPYKVERFELGRTLVMGRVPDYWARDLPTARGQFNFDRRRTEYFRDATVALQAFKAGQIDFRQENIAKEWATAYDFPAMKRGLVKKEEIRHRLPSGMQGFAMNTRREVFKDRRVRQALALVFDFEWANANLFYGAYTRTSSYFSNSDLASSGLPEAAELTLLDRYRDKIPRSIFNHPFQLPVTDGSGNNREELRHALALLREAGWDVKERKLVDANGQQMSFEILLDSPAFERIALPYVQWLGRLGIDAHVRTVDPAQFQRLSDNYDFDMTVVVVAESDSPGSEQLGFWSCAAGKLEGGDNLMGVCDPVVDKLVGVLVDAPDRDAQIAAARALDRVLLAGWYVVPHWHLQSVRIAYWDRFGRPDKPVRTGLAFDSWWLDAARAAATDAARQGQ